MRDFHDIEIVRGVSHVIAPRDAAAGLRLSEVELPLDPAVTEILAAHVAGGLRDDQAKAAVFVERGDGHASAVLAKLLGPRPRLVDVSQELARRLYDIAAKDQRVSDGTLAVLTCNAVDGEEGVVRFPAVLKLDPSATLHTVQDTDPATGKDRVRYEVDPSSLPSKHERIQKCAFLSPSGMGAEYELLVVDRQRRGETVSAFWLRDFLGAELALDARERTRRLYRGLLAARNEVEQDLNAGQLAALDRVIAGAVVGAAVNVDALVASLPVPEEIRQRVDAVLSRTLPDREFELDADVAGQFLRRRAWRADNDLRVSVRSEFASMVTVEDLEPGDGETRLRRVSFETRTWKET